MTALLDTSAIIGMTERAEQTPSVRRLLETAETDADVLVTDITLGELRHAVLTASRPQRRQRLTTYEIAEALTVVSIGGDVATIDAYAAARNEQPRCSQNDTWIIALAHRHSATLHTEDERMHRLATTCGVPTVLVASRPR